MATSKSFLKTIAPILWLALWGQNSVAQQTKQCSDCYVLEWVPLGCILEFPPECADFHELLSPPTTRRTVAKFGTKRYRQIDSLLCLSKPTKQYFDNRVFMHIEKYERGRIVLVLCGDRESAFTTPNDGKVFTNDAIWRYVYRTFGVN